MSSHGTVMSLNAERVQAVDPGFDELVAAVRAVRPRLVDAWEATAVIESLGYTDARVQQEFGFSDTRAAGSTLIYAVPWLSVFVAQMLRPEAMQAPMRVAPALALALMFSLIVSGGFVQAIVRRGEFYIGMRQPGMARLVVEALLRFGIATTVAVGLGGLFVGWYFELFAWPALILGADAFVLMSVLWMVCGIFAIRQQHWRVAIALFAG